MSHLLDSNFTPIGHIEDGAVRSHGHHLGYAKEDGEGGEIRDKNHQLLGKVDKDGHVKDRYGNAVGHLDKGTGQVVTHSGHHVGHVHHDDKLGAAALLLLMQKEKDDK